MITCACPSTRTTSWVTSPTPSTTWSTACSSSSASRRISSPASPTSSGPIGQLPEHLRAPWCDLKTIVQVERVRVTDSVSLQRAYYITSHPARAKDLARRIRDHWKIENELHYCLDVTFGEDRRPIRSQYGAENFALVTRFALSLLKKHAGAPSTNKDKQSVRRKKKIAMWSDVYFLTVLTAGFPDV